MRIFVSWSGNPAQAMAKFLQVWLVKVIQALEPFVSSDSIESGARWDAEIAAQLTDTGEGIVVVTSRNQGEPWLNFEAGALAKATDSRVRPLLIDLTPMEFNGPISSFQATPAGDKASVLKMMKEINARCERKLDEDILGQIFEREWEDFEAMVDHVIELERQSDHARPERRQDSDVLAEVLDRVRTIERDTQDFRWQMHTLGWRTSSPALSPADRERMDAAHSLIGRKVLAVVADEHAEGEVIETLTRGTGTYVRVASVDGTSRVMPLESIEGYFEHPHGNLP
ncbi:hypothetical protein [Mycobacterium marinum]|uniref:hypothetical protein n=1 Tax=Mycobacterium marinum TaxID=1781 RepID=UPI0035622280